MYIESGFLKGNKIKLQSTGLRPTTSMVKSALMNILDLDLFEGIFIDFFAGSGAVGFEAISRGAKEVWFIDNNRGAIRFLKENAKSLGVFDRIKVFQRDVFKFLEQNFENIKIMFFSPPYNDIHWNQLLRSIEISPLISTNTIVVIQHPSNIQLKGVLLEIFDERKYGFNTLSFFREK